MTPGAGARKLNGADPLVSLSCSLACRLMIWSDGGIENAKDDLEIATVRHGSRFSVWQTCGQRCLHANFKQQLHTQMRPDLVSTISNPAAAKESVYPSWQIAVRGGILSTTQRVEPWPLRVTVESMAGTLMFSASALRSHKQESFLSNLFPFSF